MFRVFINYRREDTAGHAGRLYDALAERFGEDHVFIDIDAVDPGVDFTKVVDHSVGNCDVLIALIGRRWLEVTDARGVRRLEKPEDWVRIELTRALERQEIKVVPALVHDADMPSADELPEALRNLAFRNAIELSDTRWHYDVGRLIQVLEKLEEEKIAREGGEPAPRADSEAAPAAPPGHRPRRRLVLAAAAVAAAAAAAIVAVVLAGSGDDPNPNASTAQPTAAAPTADSVPTLKDRGCDAEESLRSYDSTEETEITFENRTAGVVRIYWLDYRGRRDRYGSLQPQEEVRQSTYPTHPWVVTDAAEDCLSIYLPAPVPGRAVIGG